MKKLVCAGGGSLGVAQVRNLMAIRKNGKLDYDSIDGTSTGNLTGCCLAFAPDLSTGLDNLIKLYQNITGTNCIFDGKSGIGIPVVGDIVNVIVAGIDELATSWPGTVSNAPLYKLLQKSIIQMKPCVEMNSYITEEETGSKVIVTALTNGTFRKTVISSAFGASSPQISTYGPEWFPQYLKFVLASTSFPPECDAVTIQGMGGYVDGGVIDQVPVDNAATQPGDTVTVLLCGNWNPMLPYQGPRDGLRYGLRTIEVMLFWQIQNSLNRVMAQCKAKGIALDIWDLVPNIEYPSSDQFVPSVIKKVLEAPDPSPVYSL